MGCNAVKEHDNDWVQCWKEHDNAWLQRCEEYDKGHYTLNGSSCSPYALKMGAFAAGKLWFYAFCIQGEERNCRSYHELSSKGICFSLDNQEKLNFSSSSYTHRRRKLLNKPEYTLQRSAISQFSVIHLAQL